MGKGRFSRLRRRRKKKEAKEEFPTILDGIKKLVELRVAVVKDGKYVYSPSFEATVKRVIDKPPNKIRQLSIGRRVSRKIIPHVIGAAASFTSRRDIENMVIAFICLERHVKRLRISLSESTMLALTHPTWYLNDHEPLAEEAS